MKKEVIKAPKIAICRRCGGTGWYTDKEQGVVQCVQCKGTGRVTVSAKIEMDIRPYNPGEKGG